MTISTYVRGATVEGLDLAWQADGLCRGLDPELFFPTRGEDAAPAKEICADCPVRNDCLEHALANHENFGVWGGASERERKRIRRRRAEGRA